MFTLKIPLQRDSTAVPAKAMNIAPQLFQESFSLKTKTPMAAVIRGMVDWRTELVPPVMVSRPMEKVMVWITKPTPPARRKSGTSLKAGRGVLLTQRTLIKIKAKTILRIKEPIQGCQWRFRSRQIGFQHKRSSIIEWLRRYINGIALTFAFFPRLSLFTYPYAYVRN